MDEMSEYYEEPVEFSLLEVSSKARLHKDLDMGLNVTEGGWIRGLIPPSRIRLVGTYKVNEPGVPTIIDRIYPKGIPVEDL